MSTRFRTTLLVMVQAAACAPFAAPAWAMSSAAEMELGMALPPPRVAMTRAVAPVACTPCLQLQAEFEEAQRLGLPERLRQGAAWTAADVEHVRQAGLRAVGVAPTRPAAP